MEWITHAIAPLMFATLVLFMIIGVPAAFALAATGLSFAILGVQLDLMPATLVQALPQRVYGLLSNESLLAIPFFTLMGLILERSGMAEDLLKTVGQLFGRVRGGIAYAVIIVGALMAATTGVVSAAVISMGLISLPLMLRTGYDKRLAAGVIMASGTLAQIVPPSLVLIVLADQMGVSIGDIYQAALVPSAILIALYILYVGILSVVRPESVPALPESERAGSTAELIKNSILHLIPPLGLIFLTLGTIFLGIATPTEGGAMGALGALIMAILRRRMNISLLAEAVRKTTSLSTFVMWILIGSTIFALSFRAAGGETFVHDLFSALPGGTTGFLVAVVVLVFILGCFIDFFEIAFIAVPLLLPVAIKMGVDPLHLAIILGVVMQTSFLTPPFGFALFYLRQVAPASLSTRDIYLSIIPFIAIQLVVTAIVVAYPQISSGLVRGDKPIPTLSDEKHTIDADGKDTVSEDKTKLNDAGLDLLESLGK